MAKIANFMPKISPLNINVFMFFILNCLLFQDKFNGEKINALSLLVKILVFGPIFASRPHLGGKIVGMDPKLP